MFTTDTRKAHCPIRIAYCGAKSDSVHAHELTDRIYLSGDRPLAIIKATEFSDYSGGSVERSNYRVIRGDYDKARPGMVEIYGSHGYQALAYDATLGPVPGDEDLCEILEGLEQYPIVDDDDHDELESELEHEAWDDHGRRDLGCELVEVMDALDAGHEHELPDDDASYQDPMPDANVCSGHETWKAILWDLWRAGCDDLNVNGGSGYTVETGGGVHFYVAEWCSKAGLDKRYPTNKATHDTLRELAKICRVPE